ALASEVMRWVSHSREPVSPLGASVLRLNRATDAESVRDLLLALPGVRYVERNYLVFTCNDPLSSQQWGLTRIQAAQAWAIATPQRTVYLAIIDTGVDATHPDLAQRVRRYSNGTVYGYNTQLNNANTHDFHGHGTHCAGIAAAHTGNGIGIAGVASTAPVQIMPVKVLNDQGIGTMTDVARGIIWAADNGAQVLSLSLGGNAGTQQLADAVNYAWNRGCVVVAAAGNNGSNAPFYPAAYENALAVAASDPNDRLTDFSQYGTWVDIAAPGSSILSTVPGNRYEAWSGTSMACPHVAGAAALIWSCVPSLTNQQLRLALENNADPVQSYWFGGIGEGKGRLNLYRALQAALQMENTPTVSRLTLDPTSVTAGGTARGTVVLSRPAGAGGTVVELRSSNPTLAWCAAQITIPQGQTTGVFDIRTAANGAGSATITASSGGVSRTATLQVVSPFRVQSVAVSPAAITGGRSATLTVRLTMPAPAGGVRVSLQSNAPQASLPASVIVPAGQSSVSVQVATHPVAQRVHATLTAALNGSQASTTLTISPPAPISLTLSPSTVAGGSSATASVLLNGSAPPGGLWLRVSHNNPNRVWTPSQVYVPAGMRSVRFTVYTYRGRGVASVQITVATDGGSRSAILTVR
ncbi:MAG: S8 family serine peptidase, partial [Armatimonadota bacterium]|nr:S8 family serine peptidase [Armatimonadota bacterium]